MARIRNHCFSRWLLASWGLLLILAGAAMGTGAEPPGLPELVRSNQQVFAIPFRLPKPATPDAAAVRVELNVSQDFGLTWSVAGQATPTDRSIAYRADADGEYWFRIRAIDRENRARGGEGPDLRVLVDAAAPRLAGRVWKGADGEIICRYAAADDSIAIDAIRFTYRIADGDWKTIAAEPVLARQSPAHLIGEEIWWAGQDVDGLQVRIEVADTAGHRTSQQFSLLPSPPRCHPGRSGPRDRGTCPARRRRCHPGQPRPKHRLGDGDQADRISIRRRKPGTETRPQGRSGQPD